MNTEKLFSNIEKKALLSKRGYGTHWLNGIHKHQLIAHIQPDGFKYQLTFADADGGSLTDKNEITEFINNYTA